MCIDHRSLKKDIQKYLNIEITDKPVYYKVISEQKCKKYTQKLISFLGSEKDQIKAYLFIPEGEGPFPATLVHHQHNGERNYGKSEICGLVGDQYQGFGPELAQKGMVVLAPDSICFEDRRTNKSGVEPDDEYSDFLQHYNKMCYRILKGKTLMEKVIEDASISISLLRNIEEVENNRIGILGHSYGGNTALFQGALDERIKFTCSSGAVCSYKNKMKNGTGIEMAEVIPGFINNFEIEDLVKCFVKRDLLILSATEDKYSKDADEIYETAKTYFEQMGIEQRIVHKRYKGGHKLDKDRFNYIINWIVSKT